MSSVLRNSIFNTLRCGTGTSRHFLGAASDCKTEKSKNYAFCISTNGWFLSSRPILRIGSRLHSSPNKFRVLRIVIRFGHIDSPLSV